MATNSKVAQKNFNFRGFRGNISILDKLALLVENEVLSFCSLALKWVP